jgi:hypothetical protein
VHEPWMSTSQGRLLRLPSGRVKASAWQTAVFIEM